MHTRSEQFRANSAECRRLAEHAGELIKGLYEQVPWTPDVTWAVVCLIVGMVLILLWANVPA